MEIRCANCREAWEEEYLEEDIVHDTELSREEVNAWRSLSPAEQLSEHYRQHLRAVGWGFGATLTDLLHCPWCPKGQKPTVAYIPKTGIERCFAFGWNANGHIAGDYQI